MSPRSWMVAGAVMAGLAVALGAFGAHWLRGAIEHWISDEPLRAKRLNDWEVAVRYQMYHALGLLVVGLVASRRPALATNLAGLCFLLGPLIFSTCLYALVLSHAGSAEGWRWLGMIVPIGGALMIAGWALLAAGAWQAFAPSGSAIK